MGKTESFERVFSNGELETLCRIFGDTYSELTGSEIGHFLTVSKIDDIDSGIAK